MFNVNKFWQFNRCGKICRFSKWKICVYIYLHFIKTGKCNYISYAINEAAKTGLEYKKRPEAFSVGFVGSFSNFTLYEQLPMIKLKISILVAEKNFSDYLFSK